MTGDTAAAHRRPWLIAMAVGACALFGGTAAARAATEVRGLSLSSSPDAAALTVELSHKTNYRIFTLERPYRVVLDLSDAQRARGAHLPHTPAGIVEGVRSGVRPHGGWRLVLELKSPLPAHARWTSMEGGSTPRLVIALGSERAAALVRPSTIRMEPTPESAPPPSASSRRAAPYGAPAASTVGAPPKRPVVVAHAPVDLDRDVVVAVDAGHGGQDSGAIGRGGTEEKNVVLAIAQALADRIDEEPGMHAVLTRDRDEFLPLRERMRRARVAKADLFVSIHADSIRDREVSGSSVYVLSERGATDEAARWLAERENSADLVGGVSLSDKDSRLASVLLDLSQSANISASMTAGQRVLDALKRVEEVRKPQVQQAGFVVLKAPDVPSMLIETAYISNPTDERRLRSSSQQQKLAEAIFAGLLNYFEHYPPAGTRFASNRATGPGSAVLAGAVNAPPAALAR